MAKKKESLALKLPFEAGEHLCTWIVPGTDGVNVEIPGLLNLEVGKYPFGILYGNLPIEWNNGAASFPQRTEFRSLVGRLSSGGSVAIMNGELDYWIDTQGRATAAFAVLSRSELDANNPRKHQAIELQIDGLDAIMGIAPISQVQMPHKAGDEPIWSATVNREAKKNWKANTNTMSIRYNATIRALDFYEFRMVFGSVLRITSEEGLTIEDWWTKWVWPLRQLISLITQGPREIHAFLAIEDSNNPRASRDQVFGWNITQTTQNSSRDQIDATKALVNLTKDEANLLEILTNWQALSNSHHPLLETYGSMTTIDEQHPRSRVLLLLQALEGLHGYETAEKYAARSTKHAEKRQAVLDRAAALLESDDLKFLKRSLMKRPASGLFEALSSIFGALPVDIRPELESTPLFNEIRQSDSELNEAVTERILVKIRNDLSHGSASYQPWQLKEVADHLERVVRAEMLRVIGAPESSRTRALEKVR